MSGSRHLPCAPGDATGCSAGTYVMEICTSRSPPAKPVRLEPGARWTGAQRIQITPAEPGHRLRAP
jgi:hypothetical protein